MAIQQENGRFTLKSAIVVLTKSLASYWKPMIVAAPLIGAALFLATGTSAQTSGSTAPPNQSIDATAVAPKPAPDAARRGRGPKEKTKIDTGRTANPTTTTDPTADAPVAPIAAPEAARTGRPKIRDKTPMDTSREVSPPTTTEPVDQPTERRRKGPKGDTSSDAAGGRTETPAPDTEPVERRKGKGPKGDGGHGRTATPLIIGALGAATVLALVVSSGNDRPSSP